MTANVYPRHPRNGRTARELAEKAGKSVRTAQRWTSMSRDEWIGQTAARRLRIRELRETGLSMRAIAAEVGCSLGTVHNALKDQPEDE